MKRLTERCGEYIRITGCKSFYPGEERPGAPMAGAIARLAAYEDTGLTPEEIMGLPAPSNPPLTLEELREMDGEPVWVECFNRPSLSCFGFMDDDTFIGYHANFYIQDYGELWVAYDRARDKRKSIAPPSEEYLRYLLEKDNPKPPYQDRMVETKYKNDIPVRCPVCHYTLTLHTEIHCPVCGQRFISEKRTPFKNDPFFEEREKRAQHGN